MVTKTSLKICKSSLFLGEKFANTIDRILIPPLPSLEY